ncbi:MAG: hypothetical protein JNL77_03220 [Nitrosomonas sp.]|nr:hypothetical protein [Nitrosomonas sp.]
MSAPEVKQTVQMIRAELKRLAMQLIAIRMQRKLIGIAGDVFIYAFSRLATHSLSIKTFWLKRVLLRLSCNLHPIACRLIRKSKDLIARQSDIECRAKLLIDMLDNIKSIEEAL